MECSDECARRTPADKDGGEVYTSSPINATYVEGGNATIGNSSTNITVFIGSDNNTIPIFQYENTTGKCYGFMYRTEENECLIYDTPVFILKGVTETSGTGNDNVDAEDTSTIIDTDSDSYGVQNGDDVCFVRSQSVIASPPA